MILNCGSCRTSIRRKRRDNHNNNNNNNFVSYDNYLRDSKAAFEANWEKNNLELISCKIFAKLNVVLMVPRDFNAI